METGKIYDEDLVRYLLNETTTEEDLLVEAWIAKEEANRLHLEGLAGTLKLVAVNDQVSRIDLKAEWQHFQQVQSAGEQVLTKEIDPATAGTGTAIIREMPAGKNRKIFRLLLAGAVAASIIVLLLFRFGPFGSNQTVQLASVKDTTNRYDSLSEVSFNEVNTTAHIRSFNLPDGSVVNLFPKGELAYREPSDRKSRLVTLTGKADFSVAKDKTKPFSVFSGPISTTALGTRFTVTSIPGEKQIYVRLHEGKVVVKAEQVINETKMKDVYLIPGQELVFDLSRGTAKVRLFDKADEREIVNDKASGETLLIPNDSKKSWFMFNNQSLNSIFRMLENMYDSKIHYSKADIKRMYFIGTFNKSDSLEFILKQIADINNLEVTRDNNTYTIKKK